MPEQCSNMFITNKNNTTCLTTIKWNYQLLSKSTEVKTHKVNGTTKCEVLSLSIYFQEACLWKPGTGNGLSFQTPWFRWIKKKQSSKPIPTLQWSPIEASLRRFAKNWNWKRMEGKLKRIIKLLLITICFLRRWWCKWFWTKWTLFVNNLSNKIINC